MNEVLCGPAAMSVYLLIAIVGLSGAAAAAFGKWARGMRRPTYRSAAVWRAAI
jgi:hypothetical protein